METDICSMENRGRSEEMLAKRSYDPRAHIKEGELVLPYENFRRTFFLNFPRRNVPLRLYARRILRCP